MRIVNVSTKKMAKFEGKWVAIDIKREKIIAVGETLKEISRFVTATVGQEKKIKASAFLVPRKGEGHYVLESII